MKRKHLDMLYSDKPINAGPVIKPKKKTVKKETVSVPTEHQEQCKLHRWLRDRDIPHAAIPNANAMSFLGRDIAVRVMSKLKASGVAPGFPDMVIFLPRFMLIIELKRIKGGTVNEDQKEWINIINGYDYAVGRVCYGANQAIAEVERWI